MDSYCTLVVTLQSLFGCGARESTSCGFEVALPWGLLHTDVFCPRTPYPSLHPRELTALVLVIGLMGFDVECVNAADRLWWELLHPQWLHHVQELPQQLPAQHGV